MPRAAKPKTTTALVPYSRGSSESQLSDDIKPIIKPVKVPKKPKVGGGGGQGGYNKTLLVSLILAPAKPDWGPIAHDLNKSTSQCFDIWRKVLLPNLLSNKPWTGGSAAWAAEEKIELLMMVIAQVKINWEDVTLHFPGRSKSQVSDIWWKVVFPRLKRGDTVE